VELKGEIVDVIYKNEINSYTIANLETDSEVFTVVGYLPFINVGDNLKLEGKFVTHQEYGRQFKIDTFEKIMPETLDALERYLANGSIKGIGPVTAQKIVKEFGEETISIFKFEPEKLARIKGISKEKAIEMAQSFNENFELWQIVGFLDKFKIPVSAAQRIYKKLGENTIQIIQENPYILVDLVRTVDFKQIDKMAIDLGMEYTNPERIANGIKYGLTIITNNGHTCVEKQNLIMFLIELLTIPEDLIESEFINLRAKQKIMVEKRDETEWVYLYEFYKAEQNIAEKLLTLNNAKNVERISKIDKELKLLEDKLDIILSEKQIEAIKEINENNVCVITGGPGTGKTTIIKTVLDLYKKQGKKVALCAPTGRAAKRMEEATGEGAKTLHRLLEIGKIKDELEIEDIDQEIAPIDADVIIIDEMSMVDIFLMNYLVKAIYLGTKLVLVGDIDQLPSVGPGSVLKSIINSEKFSTVYLDKIFRQAAQSKIILNAHNVNKGEGFITQKDESLKEDFFFINEFNQEKILANILSLSKDRLKNFGDYDFFKNIQVITPSKKGLIGTRELNRYLQQELNPSKEGKKEKAFGNIVYRQGDRIMQIKNNYDIYWEKHKEEFEYGSGIFNGEFGTIVDFNEEEKQVQVLYDDDKNAWYSYQDIEQIEHAYAITVHKSQGSEFDVVVLPITASAPMLLTRNLLYTAITRAKKLLVVVGPANVINRMIQNYDSKKRNSGLEYKLINM